MLIQPSNAGLLLPRAVKQQHRRAGGPHLILRWARTDARSEAATSGPRPAPTTISTVVRVSASSCRKTGGTQGFSA